MCQSARKQSVRLHCWVGFIDQLLTTMSQHPRPHSCWGPQDVLVRLVTQTASFLSGLLLPCLYLFLLLLCGCGRAQRTTFRSRFPSPHHGLLKQNSVGQCDKYLYPVSPLDALPTSPRGGPYFVFSLVSSLRASCFPELELEACQPYTASLRLSQNGSVQHSE